MSRPNGVVVRQPSDDLFARWDYARCMASSTLKGRRVLVVDDDADILRSIELAFRVEGAIITCAADGAEAMHAIQTHAPEIVVLDMMLPQRSGLLVLESIRESESPPPVIMVTANQGRRHMAYAESLGVSAYLIKPVPLQKLIETAARLLSEA